MRSSNIKGGSSGQGRTGGFWWALSAVRSQFVGLLLYFSYFFPFAFQDLTCVLCWQSLIDMRISRDVWTLNLLPDCLTTTKELLVQQRSRLVRLWVIWWWWWCSPIRAHPFLCAHTYCIVAYSVAYTFSIIRL